MRKSSDWMTIWDDRIMEITREDGPTSASDLKNKKHIHISRSTITRRLNKLADHGLLTRLPNGVYALSKSGEKYLDGELDAAELKEQSENGDQSAQA